MIAPPDSPTWRPPGHLAGNPLPNRQDRVQAAEIDGADIRLRRPSRAIRMGMVGSQNLKPGLPRLQSNPKKISGSQQKTVPPSSRVRPGIFDVDRPTDQRRSAPRPKLPQQKATALPGVLTSPVFHDLIAALGENTDHRSSTQPGRPPEVQLRRQASGRSDRLLGEGHVKAGQALARTLLGADDLVNGSGA